MKQYFKKFQIKENGSVSLDWIVLAAGIMMLSLAVLGSVVTASDELAAKTSDTIAADDAI
jgi:hypothetical protein